jgi:signal transduction histidine kinase
VFAGIVGAFVLWIAATLLGAVAGATSGPLALAIAVAALVLFVLAVAGIARRVAAPAEDLVAAAERIEAGDLTIRVRERGPRETRSLARAFNAMAARLQANEERRRSFLADAAHELRTPLTIIRGRTEAMIDGVYPPDADQLAVILDETRTIERLVEDLRTVALLEAGALRLDREPTDPATLIGDVVHAFRGEADAAGVALHAGELGDLPLVRADPVRIRSVLVNLIVNALRHTPAGGTITVDARTTEPGLVSFSVVDDGEGMAEDLADAAFDRFAKGPSSGGSGLGLAIARELVEAHGGRISLDSRLGTGTTVTFTVPLAE